LIPRRAESNCPVVRRRDYSVVENECLDFMSVLGEDAILGLSGLILSATDLVLIVDS
jgi:hypothetical protein